MKFKHHVSNLDKNEDPLKNEKKSLDKALMTGQQKEERICTLQDHLILNEKKRGITHTKNRSQKPARRTKIFRKDYIHTKTTFLDKEKCQSRLMTCQNPFKRHRGKKKNH